MKGYIALGKVIRAHGIRGQISVLPYDQDTVNLPELSQATFHLPDGSSYQDKILSSFPHKKGYLLTLAKVKDRNQAERLAGAMLLVPREELAPLPDGEVYLADLIGFEVFSDDERKLGRLTDFIETGANDVWVVQPDGAAKKELLLPDIPEVILDIDTEQKRILVHLMPGLEEDDAD